MEEMKQKYDELGAYMEKMLEKPGPLMPVMQKAQDIFGFLSFEVQEFIAQKMNIPMVDVYGVATFYSQFALEPKGKHTIGVCMGTACYVKNSESVLNTMADDLQIMPGLTTADRLFTLESTRGCCGLAPAIMIDDQVYGRLKPDDVHGILRKYRDETPS